MNGYCSCSQFLIKKLSEYFERLLINLINVHLQTMHCVVVDMDVVNRN